VEKLALDFGILGLFFLGITYIVPILLVVFVIWAVLKIIKIQEKKNEMLGEIISHLKEKK